MRRLITLAALAGGLMASAPAFAGEAKPPAPGASTMLMSPVAIPVVINGRLANYIYVTMRLNLAPGADGDKLRAKEPFFRDGLIRSAYSAPLQLASDPNKINEPALRAVMLAQGARIAGRGVVTGIKLTRAQPQRFLSKPTAPRPPAPKAPIV